MRVELRYPSGHWHVPSVQVGEWKLLRTRDGQWRIWRNRKGAGWSVATRRSLLLTLLFAWRRRDFYPHEVYR